MNDLRTDSVLIVGAGNAALCAALSAREQGADVLVLEKASRQQRGGNSALTVNMRFAYDEPNQLLPLVDQPSDRAFAWLREARPSYCAADFYDDIMNVTRHESDPRLADIVCRDSYKTISWLRGHGHCWSINESREAGSLPLWLDGKGYELQKRSFFAAEQMGIGFIYDAEVVELKQDSRGSIVGLVANIGGKTVQVHGSCVVLACGGFEADAKMRAEHLGSIWASTKVRGVPFNTGDGLRMALDVGAVPYGNWSSCHASPQDADLTESTLPEDYLASHDAWRYAYPYGILVNKDGQRFVDEGETLRALTYAKIGRAIQSQPGAIAFQIFDSQVGDLLAEGYARAPRSSRSGNLEQVARDLGVNVRQFMETVAAFNAAAQPGNFDPQSLDGKATKGLPIPKSNWALPISTPPFLGFPVICGITFTFGGVKIDQEARVVNQYNDPIPGLFAAGEMVGGLFSHNYPGGSGLTAGAVIGRRAGRSAGLLALKPPR